MQTVDTLVIGFGKAGKTLAGALAKRGERVVLVEKSSQMYGGTCINIACIPSKTLEFKSRKYHEDRYYERALTEKRQFIAKLRQKNYDKIAGTGAEIVDGVAYFLDRDHVRVEKADGTLVDYAPKKILINTGAVNQRIAIPGLETSKRVMTSTELLDCETLPERLVIVGTSFIGLEFASIFTNFGAKVTLLQRGEVFLPKTDREMAATIKQDLLARGIEILEKAQIVRGVEGDALTLTVSVDGEERTLSADGVLLALGRKPLTEGLGLDKAGVELDERGAIRVTSTLKTTNPKVWAAGDVKGGPQFTYVSLDDFRIVLGDMLGKGERSTENRPLMPYAMFIDPPYAHIGLTEEEAKAKGLDYVVSKLPAAGIPKANIMESPRGLLKVILEKGTEKILGAHFYCVESHEIIHIIQMAMRADLPYSVIRNNIFAHPTIAEALNDL